MKRPLRIAVSLALLVSQFVVATATHHHSNQLFDNILAEDATGREFVHDIACLAPKAIHWHADRIIEIEPCLACLRQHLTGTEVSPPDGAPVPAVAILEPEAPQSPVAGFILDASSRGPPSAA
jgi:hypothetical protein